MYYYCVARIQQVLGWLRNLTATKREPTYTELMTRLLEIESEWRSFLEQQARISRRQAKRDRDDLQQADRASEGNVGDSKAEIRRRAVEKGLFQPRRIS